MGHYYSRWQLFIIWINHLFQKMAGYPYDTPYERISEEIEQSWSKIGGKS